MAHTVLWPKKTFFYPIGNTAPISFSQTLPPEIPANALLLGCGDPRSILYTVYSDLQNPKRTLDFTCCDLEAAVLARNVLLLTLIIDDTSSETLDHAWNIFFHFYLNKSSLELLQIQCRKLISLSSTLETWENGQYSTTIRFCSRFTLTELHRYWGMYLETPDLVHKDQEDLRTAFKKGMQAARDKLGGDVVLTSGASAGPLWASVIPSGSTHFQQFWIKGVTHSDDETSDATLVNPAFAYDSTGRGFNVHYGTDPLISFHLAMVAQLPASNHPASISDLVQLAKTQFRSWCSAFRDRITIAKNVVIRMFVGDALAFSQTLLYCTRTGSIHSGAYVSPWVGVQASLDGGDYDTVSTNRAPLSFNVIDTSNLTDSMGLLNVLIMAVPLLERSTAAVLNTNTLLTSEDGGGSPGGLTYRACADISTLSLLLGIVPVSYVSGFTSQSNTHEATGISRGKERCHEPLSWRFAPVLGKVEADNLPRALQIEAPLLGQILFNIYLRMFSDEILTAALKQGAFVHYVRTSFAALLALVRQNVQTAWKQAMDHMIDCVEADRVLFTGANHYQDLCCQLHLHGVYTVDTLNERNSPAPGAGPFKLWKHVPPVVCVVLKVPRQSLRVLEDVNPDQVGTPIMQCEVIGPGVQNSFSSIQCFFGETLSGAAVHDLLIQEDADRWMGDSALIASFHVPSWILNFQPASTQIRFSIRGGAACNPMLYSVLGMPPNIFSARLLDNTHVRVVATRPDNAQELKRLYSDFSSNLDPQTKPEATLESQNHVSVIVDKKSHNALGLTSRVSFHNPNDQKTLRECDASKAKIKQVSPCSMMLSLSTLNKLLTFPYPINGSNYKSRIAKKSSYIEVDVDLCRPAHKRLALNSFPITTSQSFPALWNVHYVNLAKSPVVDTNMKWLPAHLELSLSDSELSCLKALDRSKLATITSLKAMISRMLSDVFHIGQPPHLILLRLSPNSGYACNVLVLFLECLRLDLSAHTVVADASVLALTPAVLEIQAGQQLLDLMEPSSEAMKFEINDAETTAWWQLLPVLAERCRTWTHTSSCKYSNDASDSLQEEQNPNQDSPLCGCGSGQDILPSLLQSDWKDVAPYTTRIALSPLFAMAYLESIGSSARDKSFGLDVDTDDVPSGDVCRVCGGRGKPKIMSCSVCYKVKYCSRACQKGDWKRHKVECRKGLAKGNF